MKCRVFMYAAAMACILLMSGCSLLWGQKSKNDADEAPKIPPPLHIGAVHQVYPAQKFALLRIIGPMPAPGTTLISHPADGSTVRIGNLEVPEGSAPRNGVIVADIRSGTVMSGDRVFLYRNVTPPNEEDLRRAQSAKLHASSVPSDDTAVESSLPAEPVQPAVEQGGVEVTTPPATAPTLPAAPSEMPGAPNLPVSLPGYLNDIPDNIKEWE